MDLVIQVFENDFFNVLTNLQIDVIFQVFALCSSPDSFLKISGILFTYELQQATNTLLLVSKIGRI